MVEGGRGHSRRHPGQAEHAHRRFEHDLVDHIGQQRAVKMLAGFPRDHGPRLHPQLLSAAAGRVGLRVEGLLDVADVEGRGLPEETADGVIDRPEDLDGGFQTLGSGDRGRG